MKRFVGEVLLKNLIGTWRSLEFVGVSFRDRLFVGLVRFEHVKDQRQPMTLRKQAGL